MTVEQAKWYIKNRKYAKYTVIALYEDFQTAVWDLKEYLPKLGFAIFLLVFTVIEFVIFPITYLVVRISGEKANKRMDNVQKQLKRRMGLIEDGNEMDSGV